MALLRITVTCRRFRAAAHSGERRRRAYAILADPRSAYRPTSALLEDVATPSTLALSRFEGSLTHPGLSAEPKALSLTVVRWLEQQQAFVCRWDVAGQGGKAVLSLDAAAQKATVSCVTPLGTVLLEAPLDISLSGSCTISGVAGGSFVLTAVDHSAAIATSMQANRKRLEVIFKYSKLVRHPELFPPDVQWQDAWLAPSFQAARAGGAWREILTEHVPGYVFSFELLTPEFCGRFIEEILNFYASGLPAKRPNSMNNYGVILSDIGMEPLMDALQAVLQPLGKLLFPDGEGVAWDDCHAFIVRYREGEDLGLDMHHDDSDVTFNVCLGRIFEGAGLQFCGLNGSAEHRRHRYTYRHSLGRCLVHLGRHRHGADDLSSGDRMNLILWNRSSAYRRHVSAVEPAFDREAGKPDELCLSYTHDRDYGVFRSYPPNKSHLARTAWCPPKDREYEGFEAGKDVDALADFDPNDVEF